jgi:ABC-type transport system involved in multi-copper enzyme maturation permease subunit
MLIVFSVIAVSKTRFHSAAGSSRSSSSSAASGSDGKIRPIKGSPIIWKESLSATSGKKLILKIVCMVLSVVAIITAYIACIVYDALDSPQIHAAFILGYFFLALLRIAVVSAASITSERESRTWPILLSTPLEKRDIIKGKILASINRARPFWILIAIHLVVFTLLGKIHPFALAPLAILFTASAVATASIGTFISSCCKRTSIASAVNLVVFFICIVPVCCLNPLPFIGPLTLGGIIVSAAASPEMAPTSFMPFGMGMMRNADISEISTFLILIAIFIAIMLIYLLVAYVAYVIAQSNVRSKIF